MNNLSITILSSVWLACAPVSSGENRVSRGPCERNMEVRLHHEAFRASWCRIAQDDGPELLHERMRVFWRSCPVTEVQSSQVVRSSQLPLWGEYCCGWRCKQPYRQQSKVVRSRQSPLCVALPCRSPTTRHSTVCTRLSGRGSWTRACEWVRLRWASRTRRESRLSAGRGSSVALLYLVAKIARACQCWRGAVFDCDALCLVGSKSHTLASFDCVLCRALLPWFVILNRPQRMCFLAYKHVCL